ncbi:MAG: DUF748 domain-containing protein [Gammaproteobacteria bacterium]
MNARKLLTSAVKPFCIMGGLLILYALAGFFLLPWVLQARMPELIEQSTGRTATINKVRFDPFSFRLDLEGFSILEPDGGPFAAFDRFYVDLNVFRSMTHGALTLDALLLEKPVLRLARLKNGRFNFDDLVKSEAEPAGERSAIFPVVIEALSLAEGHVIWEDARFGKPVVEEIKAIHFKVDQLSTLSSELFPLHFSCALESGGQLDWEGSVSVQPFSSTGRVKLDRLRFDRIRELALPEAVNFDIQGVESLDLDYKVDYSAKGIDLDIKKSRLEIRDFGYLENIEGGIQFKSSGITNEAAYKISLAGNQWRLAAENARLELKDIHLYGPGNGKASLEIPYMAVTANYQADNADDRVNLGIAGDKIDVRGLKLIETGQKDALAEIKTFNLNSIGFDLVKQELSIASVQSEEGRFKAWLNPEGQINYLKFLPETPKDQGGSKSSQSSEAGSPAAAPWNISLDRVALNKYAVAFEDRTLKQPVTIHAKPVDIQLGRFSNKAGASMPLEFSAGINESGSIRLDGDLVVNPFSARLNVAIQNIELERFQPYVDQFARLDIIHGQWNADGNLSIALPAKEGLDLKFKGNTGITGLLTRDQILHRDFVKWKKLTLQAIDADVAANRYTAKLLLINDPYARVVIAKDKTINVNDVLTTGQARPARKETADKRGSKDAGRPYFRLDKIQVVNGSSDFADLSLILPFAAQIESLNGGAAGISSERKSSVKVSLKGNAYDLAPVAIDGDVSPYLGEYNVEMNFLGMPMPLVSPYMVQFAGYKVEKGKLTLGLKYQVAKGQLTASNNIVIDQFELGEKVENPNAVSVPLELAVALLKDSRGKIKLDVPITGSLEDPKFSLGKIITDALLNTLSKIVTSPFNAIASLIGSEDNPDAVSFAAGSAELDKQQVQKLYGIASALKERPILTIDIKGAAYEEQDWPAMRQAALYDQLKKMKADEINKKSGVKTLAEYVKLSEDDYKRLLAQLFIDKFPLLADRSLFGTPRLKDPNGGDFYDVARQKLAEIIKPNPHRLKRLAARRAQAIAKYLVQQGGIPNERVYILDAVVDPERDDQEIVSFLSLKTG